MSVVALGVLEVGEKHLVDGDAGRRSQRPRKAVAVGFPLGEDAGILGPAFGRAVLAQQHVMTAAESVRRVTTACPLCLWRRY